MAKYTTSIGSVPGGFFSNSLGTQALNAVSAITGVINAVIVREDDAGVVVSYEWVGHEKFLETTTHLAKYGLVRLDWDVN